MRDVDAKRLGRCGDGGQRGAIAAEHTDAGVVIVGHKEVAVCVQGDVIRKVQLALSIALCAKRLQQYAAC